MTSPPIPPKSEPPVGVVLPCTQAEFGQFVSNLLGRPQTIRRIKECNFDLTRSEIENTYHLIDQRLTQNSGTLVDFTIRIGYTDNSSIELKSLSEFQSFREVRPLVSENATLAWTYLVTFPGTNVPEKQSIEITFATDGFSFPDGLAIFRGPRFNQSHIRFEIKHTSRTWGADIESLLNGHIGTLTNDESGIRPFICSHNAKIGIFSSLFFIVLATIGAVTAANAIAGAQISQFSSVQSSATTIQGLSEQVADLSTIVASGTWHRFNFLQGVYFIAALVVAVILGIWVSAAADNPQPSFLQLSDKAIQQRKTTLDARRKGWWKLAISGFVTVVAGVCTRVIFYYISEWWLR